MRQHRLRVVGELVRRRGQLAGVTHQDPARAQQPQMQPHRRRSGAAVESEDHRPLGWIQTVGHVGGYEDLGLGFVTTEDAVVELLLTQHHPPGGCGVRQGLASDSQRVLSDRQVVGGTVAGGESGSGLSPPCLSAGPAPSTASDLLASGLSALIARSPRSFVAAMLTHDTSSALAPRSFVAAMLTHSTSIRSAPRSFVAAMLTHSTSIRSAPRSFVAAMLTHPEQSRTWIGLVSATDHVGRGLPDLPDHQADDHQQRRITQPAADRPARRTSAPCSDRCRRATTAGCRSTPRSR